MVTNHAVLTRINFEDKDLMDKYLKFTKEFLIPSFKSQTCKDFNWVVICKEKHIDYLKDELKYPFIRIKDRDGFSGFVKKHNFQIQTRHDCDDWMAPNYIETIQRLFKDNKDKYKSFLIQSQPLKLIYKTGEQMKIGKYHNRRCSMHLTLCQNIVINHIHSHQHGHMWKVTDHIIDLGEGYTKWIIHDDNVSVNKANLKGKKLKDIT